MRTQHRFSSLLFLWILTISASLTSACAHIPRPFSSPLTTRDPQELHFKSLRQVTNNGKSTHPQWLNSETLIYEDATLCSQIFSLDLYQGDSKRLSNGRGLALRPVLFQKEERILFSSTMATHLNCQVPSFEGIDKKITTSPIKPWFMEPALQLYASHRDGKDPLPLQPGAPRAYHSEGRGCNSLGDKFVIFASNQDKDLHLYRGELDSFNVFAQVRKITEGVGYNGQPAFSPDCNQMVWISSRPKTEKEIKRYRELLEKNIFVPAEMEIWIANTDGSNARQLTQTRAIQLSPTFSPDGKSIVFASNMKEPKTENFHLYQMGLDGSKIQQITFSQGSELSPAFSPDGRNLAFASNRNFPSQENFDLFVAEWQELP
jgi:Tol biopolymer transport system component